MARAFRIWSIFILLEKIVRASEEHKEECRILEEEIDLLKGDRAVLEKKLRDLEAQKREQVARLCLNVVAQSIMP